MKASRGFSLIELVIAIVVLSIAVGALLMSLAAMTRSTVLPEVLDISTHLAEQELERVTGRRYSLVVNEGPTAFGSPFSDYTYQVTVSAVPGSLVSDPLMVNYKQVQVSVSSTAGGSVSLTTIVTRRA